MSKFNFEHLVGVSSRIQKYFKLLNKVDSLYRQYQRFTEVLGSDISISIMFSAKENFKKEFDLSEEEFALMTNRLETKLNEDIKEFKKIVLEIIGIEKEYEEDENLCCKAPKRESEE